MFRELIISALVAGALAGCEAHIVLSSEPPKVRPTASQSFTEYAHRHLGSLPKECRTSVLTIESNWENENCEFISCPFNSDSDRQFVDKHYMDPLAKWAETLDPIYRDAYLQWIGAGHANYDKCRPKDEEAEQQRPCGEVLPLPPENLTASERPHQ